MYTEKVVDVFHYGESMFRFRTTRDTTFRFKNGEFAMIGMYSQKYKREIHRAYSIVSTSYDDYLEFLSIKIEDGPLTSELQHIQPGDEILIKPKTTGSLCADYLTPKENLVMLSTGTGLAPFVSIIRDPYTYERFKNVYLFHTVRKVNELAFSNTILDVCNDVPLTYIPTVTQEPYEREGRFWKYLPGVLGHELDYDIDGVMVCGSMQLNKECRDKFSTAGWQEGNTGEMGDFLLERAFVG